MGILFDSFLIAMEVMAFFLVADVYFERQYNGIKATIIAIACYITVFKSLEKILNLKDVNAQKSLVVILSFSALAMLFYRGMKAKQFFLTCIFYIILYAVDYFIIAGSLLVLNIDLSMLFKGQYFYKSAAILAKCILLFICYIFSKRFHLKVRAKKFSLSEWIRILIIPACMILNLTIVVYESLKTDQITGIVFIDILLLILGTFVYLYLEKELEKKKQIEIDNLILEQEIHAEKKQLELIKSHFKEQRKMTHDFRNHLCVIRELLKDQKSNEKVLRYIEQLTGKSDVKMPLVQTENPIIDALLNQKYHVCKIEKIPVFFELSNLNPLQIDEEAIVVILSNTIDNAIEACRKQGESRFIKVKMISNDDETIFSIQNTVNKGCEVSLEKIQSTKEEKLFHGYGLKNAVQAVENSGGICGIECQNGVFQFTAFWH